MEPEKGKPRFTPAEQWGSPCACIWVQVGRCGAGLLGRTDERFDTAKVGSAKGGVAQHPPSCRLYLDSKKL